jgi:hypothetical protein
MSDDSSRAVSLAEAIDHVAAIMATLSCPDEVTGAAWRLDLDVPEELAPRRSLVVVYTIDGSHYHVTRDASGLHASLVENPAGRDAAWESGYESGFCDGANDSGMVDNLLADIETLTTSHAQTVGALCQECEDARAEVAAMHDSYAELIGAARGALADAEGYGRTFIAANIAPSQRGPIGERIRARCDRLRAALELLS